MYPSDAQAAEDPSVYLSNAYPINSPGEIIDVVVREGTSSIPDECGYCGKIPVPINDAVFKSYTKDKGEGAVIPAHTIKLLVQLKVTRTQTIDVKWSIKCSELRTTLAEDKSAITSNYDVPMAPLQPTRLVAGKARAKSLAAFVLKTSRASLHPLAAGCHKPKTMVTVAGVAPADAVLCCAVLCCAVLLQMRMPGWIERQLRLFFGL